MESLQLTVFGRASEMVLYLFFLMLFFSDLGHILPKIANNLQDLCYMWISFCILAASFKCSVELECVLMAHTYLKRAIVAYPLLKSGQFRLLGINTICSHCLDYCTRMGIIYLKRCGLLSIIKQQVVQNLSKIVFNSPTLFNNNPLSSWELRA